MMRSISIILIFVTIIGVFIAEQVFFNPQKERILLLQSDLSTVQNSDDLKRKKDVIAFAQTFIEKQPPESKLLGLSIDEKLQYYIHAVEKYFPEALYGQNRVSVLFSGKVISGSVKELYPSVYEAPAKILVSFRSSIVPYALIAQSVDRFCRSEGVLLTDLKLNDARMELVFSVLGPFAPSSSTGQSR